MNIPCDFCGQTKTITKECGYRSNYESHLVRVVLCQDCINKEKDKIKEFRNEK